MSLTQTCSVGVVGDGGAGEAEGKRLGTEELELSEAHVRGALAELETLFAGAARPAGGGKERAALGSLATWRSPVAAPGCVTSWPPVV